MGKSKVLTNLSPWLTVCVLLRSDRSTAHTIIVIGEWGFDFTSNYAMTLSQQMLDWGCSSDDVKYIFMSVHIRQLGVIGRKQRQLCMFSKLYRA